MILLEEVLRKEELSSGPSSEAFLGGSHPIIEKKVSKTLALKLPDSIKSGL